MMLFNKHSASAALFALFAHFAIFSTVYAQQKTATETPEDAQNIFIIDKLAVHFEGSSHVAEDAVMAHIKLRKGMNFDQRALDASVRSLYETGL